MSEALEFFMMWQQKDSVKRFAAAVSIVVNGFAETLIETVQSKEVSTDEYLKHTIRL